MRVLVTGAAGHVGRAVVPALISDPRVTSVLATDLAAGSPFADPRVTYVARDLTGEGAEDLLGQVDAAIHLAFRVERRPGEDPATTNVAAAHRFLRAAAARLETLVFASSVVAYGYPDAPVALLREDQPSSPARGFYYAEHKIAAEALLAELAATCSARIVIARPCVVGGPSIPAGRARPYQGPVMWVPRTPWAIRYQMIHEADLATAFAALLHAPAGVYNVAPDDAITLPEAAALLGQRPVTLPRWACLAICEANWRLGLGELGADWVRTLDWPSHVMDNAKLRGLGWAPRHGTRDAIRATAGREPR